MLETLVAIYHHTMERNRDRVGFRYKQDGAWHDITFGEMDRRVTSLASALIEVGVRPGDRIGLLSENRPEWVQTDLAIQRIGAINVPIYMTLSPKQLAYIINDSRPEILVCSSREQLDKLLEAAKEADSLRLVVVMDAQPVAGAGPEVVTYADFVAKGRELGDKHVEAIAQRERSVEPQSIASIIYTSGTTGNPKGVMLSHRNHASNASSVLDLIELRPEDSSLSFLPLCHVFERVAYYAFLMQGATTAYAESIDAVAANLLEVKPTFMISVPRLFEKIRARVLASVNEGSLVKRALFTWALDLGRRAYLAKEQGQEPGPWTAMELKLADQLVFSKVRERTGGRLRCCVSGGAALPREVGLFFQILGITVLEGYGLTESSPVIACNRSGRVRLGTVGEAIPHVEIKIADDGEILARGPNIMLGYFNNEEATREAITPDGWLHTGDVGALSADGYLTITDRKKEILVMSNGKNVAPQPIEGALSLSPFIAQSMVLGDGRNYITALVVPNFDNLLKEAKDRGWSEESHEALVQKPEVRALLRREIDLQTKDFARYEQIKEFAILPSEFTQANDELTPKLSLKRRVVLKRHQAAIDAIYDKTPVPAR